MEKKEEEVKILPFKKRKHLFAISSEDDQTSIDASPQVQARNSCEMGNELKQSKRRESRVTVTTHGSRSNSRKEVEIAGLRSISDGVAGSRSALAEIRKTEKSPTEDDDDYEIPQLDIKVDGCEVKFIFEKVLKLTELLNRHVIIPTKYAEKYFPPLKTLQESYKEEKILFSDGTWKKWWMEYKFNHVAQAYIIFGRSWRDFMDLNDLRVGDKVRVFKVHNNVQDRHFFVDFVKKERKLSDFY